MLQHSLFRSGLMSENRAQSAGNGGEPTRSKPVEERLRFDATALERYLATHIEGLRGPLRVGQFEGGQSNPDLPRNGVLRQPLRGPP